MNMTPDEFKAGLEASFGEEPPHPSISADVTAGRRRLRTQRIGTVAVGCSVTTAIGGLGFGLVHSRNESLDGIPSASNGPQSLMDACRNGNNSAKAVAKLFAGGEPTIEASAETVRDTTLALLSTDGEYWANCVVFKDDEEFHSAMTVYPSQGESTDSMYSAGSGCGLVDGDVDPDCTTFSIRWVDRRPHAVAAAQFLTVDGQTTTVDAHNGFIVFDYLGDLPAGATSAVGDLPYEVIKKVTFVNAAGDPIAAEMEDGTGLGEDGERVPGLPSITTYPAQRGAEVI